ncbi:hypothetical protein BDR26DRAFT_920768 [Obelidium mucronatum]|nr:hypothetical protein BDR26DRAFT_920768 [Obelidium mucronatum]
MGKHNNRPPRQHKRANPIYSATPTASNTNNNKTNENEPEEEQVSSNLNHLLKDQIVPILKKIQSEKADERSWASAAVSSLVLDPSSRIQLLKGNITQILVTRLSIEPDLSVRVDLAGCLANLALFGGGEDVALDLVRKGAVAAVLNQLTNVYTVVEQVKLESQAGTAAAPVVGGGDAKKLKKQQISVFEERKNTLALFEQCVSVLWALCDVGSSKEAFDLASSDIRITELLLAGIDFADVEFEGAANKVSLAIACAQCLVTLTEENPTLQKYTSNPTLTPRIQTLHQISTNQYLPPAFQPSPNNSKVENLVFKTTHFRILATAILTNLSSTTTAHVATATAHVLTSQSIQQICKDVVHASQNCLVAAANSTAAGGSSSAAAPELTTAGERALDAANTYLSAVQVGLEILANAYSEDYVEKAGGDNGGEEDEEWGDDDDAMEDGEEGDDASAFDQMMEDEELAAQMAAESGGAGAPGMEAQEGSASRDLEDRVSVIERLGLIELILSVGGAGTGSGIETVTQESPFYSFVELLNSVRIRAFGCLQNILTCLSGTPWYSAGNTNVVERIWGLLFDAANNGAAASGGGAINVVETIEAAVSAIWALARGVDEFKGASKKIVLTPSLAQINNLIATTTTLPSATETLQLKCISTLGLLAKSETPPETNATIGPFLLSVINNDQIPIQVISEALNAIYDVYADAAFKYDRPVFVQGGFLKVLKSAYPKLKVRVKALDKRRFREVRDRADEAMLNLGAFIRYKEGEAAGKN